MKRFLNWYSNLISRYPLLSKSVTTGALFAAGDGLCQLIEDGSINSSERMLRMCAVGALWTGPVLHFYFKFLSSLKLKSALKTMLVDQTLGATVLTATFFFIMGFLEVLGGSDELTSPMTNGIDKVTSQLVPTMIANWYVWPFLNYISFRFIELEYRVLWASAWGVLWNAYLSSRANMQIDSA
eukprot:TRINITY_DN4628_c0_g1_i1.p1 TRINITY_DN4628_c0_g1~~TRINITY_DN4628_c0_g1_i1.p1  ORF type:complete len:204 (+),score=19.85 TRINITY_DN4628_c0_g1_i1:66-614(+)